MTKEQVIKLLEGLGATPDEVALNLKKQGIRGYPASPNWCPIAQFLNRNSTGRFFVTVDRSTIFIRDSLVHITDYVDTSVAINSFIQKFDEGRYPYLYAGMVNE